MISSSYSIIIYGINHISSFEFLSHSVAKSFLERTTMSIFLWIFCMFHFSPSLCPCQWSLPLRMRISCGGIKMFSSCFQAFINKHHQDESLWNGGTDKVYYRGTKYTTMWKLCSYQYKENRKDGVKDYSGIKNTLFHFESNYIPCHPWKFPVLPLIPKYLRIFSLFFDDFWAGNL